MCSVKIFDCFSGIISKAGLLQALPWLANSQLRYRWGFSSNTEVTPLSSCFYYLQYYSVIYGLMYKV